MFAVKRDNATSFPFLRCMINRAAFNCYLINARITARHSLSVLDQVRRDRNGPDGSIYLLK